MSNQELPLAFIGYDETRIPPENLEQILETLSQILTSLGYRSYHRLGDRLIREDMSTDQVADRIMSKLYESRVAFFLILSGQGTENMREELGALRLRRLEGRPIPYVVACSKAAMPTASTHAHAKEVILYLTLEELYTELRRRNTLITDRPSS